jgi:hypothetical protein
MNNNASLGAYGIMYVVKNRKSDVLGLLLRNGVVVPSNASDITIALAVTNLLKVSKSFYVDFSKLLLNEDTLKGMSLNMSGSYANVEGFTFQTKEFKPLDLGGYGNSTTSTSTPTTTTTTTKPKESSNWLNQALQLAQTGFQGYLQLDDNKTKRELADASVRLSESGQGSTTNDTPPSTGWSTGAIVGVSLLGVTVVGLVIYLIAKNKNQ